MSRKQMLAKKVAHTLLAMSIVSASGLNLLAGTAWAAADGTKGDDKVESVVIGDGAYNKTLQGGNGTPGAAGTQLGDGTNPADNGGNGGNGGSVKFNNTLSANDNTDKSMTATGGNGERGGNIASGAAYAAGTILEGKGGNGGAGGDAVIAVSAENSTVAVDILTLTATGGWGAVGGYYGNGSYPIGGTVSGDGGAAGNAATSLEITDAALSANAIIMTVKGGAGGAAGADWGRYGGTSGTAAAGGAALGEGLKLAGKQAAAEIARDITITSQGGQGGASGSSYGGHVSIPGVGGAAAAYGLNTTGSGAFTAQFANIKLTATAGKGGSGHFGLKYAYDDSGLFGATGSGGTGGSAEAVGVTHSGGTLNVTGQGIESKATGGAGGAGGGQAYCITGGAGGTGGIATAAGVRVLDGVFEGTLSADIVISAAGGAGSNGSSGGGGDSSKSGEYINGADGGNGGMGGEALAYGVTGAVGSSLQVSANAITVTGQGGAGGNGGSGGYSVRPSNNRGANGGNAGNGSEGGSTNAYGVWSEGAAKIDVATSIKVQATGGNGSNGGDGSDGSSGSDGTSGINDGEGFDSGNNGAGGNGGNGGSAYAYGAWGSSTTEVSVGSISTQALGGNGGNGGNGGGKGRNNGGTGDSSGGKGGIGSNGGTGGAGGTGGVAYAYGLYGAAKMTGNSISIEATGGAGGIGSQGGAGDKGGDAYENGTTGAGGNGEAGSKGGAGGNAYAYGILSSGTAEATVNSISVKATGGAGGAGGAGGNGGNSGDLRGNNGNRGNGGDGGNGSDGGTGGNAYAYGVWGSEKAVLKLTVDNITAEALAGDGGTVGTGGDGGKLGSRGSGGMEGNKGTDGEIGQKGAQAEAYGVYATKGAVITLNAKTDGGNGGTITIGAKAGNTATPEGSKAYAVYADNATVLFNDNAVLNSDGTNPDDTVITYLNNATLGFGSPAEGQNVGRTINGGTLQLAGSNTFKVATDFSDLANIKSDSFIFAKLAADSSTATQYITVGYDKAFDGSKLDSFVGDVTVLTVTDLNSQKLNFAGKESEMDDPLTRFLATPTVAVSADSTGNGGVVKITQIDFAEAGASETVMTAADTQMSIGNLWRVEGNNLMKRMGDLRSDPEAAEGGVWARYYRGEMSADSAYDRSFDQDYTAFQGGIDKVQDYKGGKLYTGIAVNRIDSNASYNSGSGDLSSTGVGVYASWLGSKGHYLDVIARGSKLANDFKLVDKSGNTAKGDYDTWAYGISAEYGYRQDLQGGWFVEPQAELSLGRIQSAGYEMSNGARIENKGVDSAVTRVGILGGKEFTIGGRPSNAYLKASLLHDFGSNGGATAYYRTDSLVMQTGDLTGTWYEIGLGANLGLAKNSNLYFDTLKTFGGNLRTEWQFNAGLRFTF